MHSILQEDESLALLGLCSNTFQRLRGLVEFRVAGAAGSMFSPVPDAFAHLIDSEGQGEHYGKPFWL